MAVPSTLVEPPTPPTENFPPSQPRRQPWRWLIAPLLTISLVLHGALLFVPLPTWDASAEQEEEEPPQEAPEVISLSAVEDLPPLEEVPEPPQDQTPPSPDRPPASSQAAPPRPDQIPADAPLPTETPADDTFPVDDPFEPTPPPEDTGGFDPDRARARAGAARGSALGREFGGINSDPGLVAASLSRGWPPTVDQSFFFSSLATSPVLVPKALDALFFTRSYDFIITDELPRLFGDELLPQGEYGNAALYEVQSGGSTEVFVSVIGIGPGNPAGTAVVIIWESDPRL